LVEKLKGTLPHVSLHPAPGLPEPKIRPISVSGSGEIRQKARYPLGEKKGNLPRKKVTVLA
jgi:hypothetical protein